MLRRNGFKDFKTVKFWKDHYRYQGKIWNIYAKKPYLLSPIKEGKKLVEVEINSNNDEKELKVNNAENQIFHQDLQISGINKIENIGEKNYKYWEENKIKYFKKINYINKYVFKHADPNSFCYLFAILEDDWKKDEQICYYQEDKDKLISYENEFFGNNREKIFEETIIEYCPGCDEVEEMYYGICLECGDEANLGGTINPKELPKWLPNPKLYDYEEKLKQVKEYLRFNERLKDEELKELEKEFDETFFIYCSNCDEITEMYYGICLNCGDEAEKKFALNENESVKWMPKEELKGIEKAVEIRKYLKEKMEKKNNEYIE